MTEGDRLLLLGNHDHGLKSRIRGRDRSSAVSAATAARATSASASTGIRGRVMARRARAAAATIRVGLLERSATAPAHHRLPPLAATIPSCGSRPRRKGKYLIDYKALRLSLTTFPRVYGGDVVFFMHR